MRDAETAALEKAKQQLFLDLADPYLKVLSLQQDLINLKQLLDILNRRAELLEARLRRGESPANESLSAQAQHASLEAEMALAEAELAAAQEQFGNITTLPAETVLKDPGVVIVPAEIADDIPEAAQKILDREAEIIAAAKTPGFKAADLRKFY